MSLDFTRPSDELLAALAEPGLDRMDASHVAAVFAHPDDETIGCGAQLARLDGVSVVIVTDGAPRDLHDARRLGFASAEAYAAARHRELARALSLAAVAPDRIACLQVPDQEAPLRLRQITLGLAKLFAEREIRAVITHAYEAGHPDHDATAFCVHAAASLRRRSNGRGVAIIEVPLYRLGARGIVRQQFTEGPRATELTLRLTARQQDLKRRMVDAHRTQHHVLAPFTLDIERLRPAPPYDFSKLPNGGRLLYERHAWGLDGARWITLATTARAEFCLGGGPC